MDWNSLNIQQLLLVVTPSWDAISGKLYCYEIASNWQQKGEPISVDVGQKGLAWGRGLHQIEATGPSKKEGDLKAPAGCFLLGTAFGDQAHRGYAKSMPFLLVNDDLECVDDSHSMYYNQFVHRLQTSKPDWKSSEEMAKIGDLYALGLFVEHNVNPVISGQGSCIFMHIRREPGLGSAGCTVMEEKDLNSLVSWLDKSKNPCLIQLPLEEYHKRKKQWKLPILSS